MTTNTEQLKPCPFCGDAEPTLRDGQRPRHRPRLYGEYYVNGDDGVTYYGKTLREALKKALRAKGGK